MSGTTRPAGDPIAIVGIGCRFPGGISDPAGFWNALEARHDAIGEIPADRFDLGYFYDERPATPGRVMTRWGGFLDELDRFDAAFFGISPREAERLDPAQRLVLECAWEALEDAGLDATRLDGSATGVFVGQWLSDFEARLFADPEQVDFYMTTGSGRYCTSGRLSYLLGLMGPSLTVDTACSSSLVAVHLAVRSLRSGDCQLAIAGGVNVILQPHISVAYSQSRMMAQDGHCKFGDAAGDGYVRSEGAGLIVLKPLARAHADGDRIYAVIRGSAVNNDGHSSGSMGTPSRAGQEALLRRAHADAAIDPAALGYVEAHGTGTRAGDPVELGALGAVLGGGRADGTRTRVGSVKTNFGHTEGAAGVAGLIKVALALHRCRIPASLHCRTLNPAVDWATAPFEIAREPSDWQGANRLGGVSAFGIAGTNAHVVLEGAPEQASVAPGIATVPLRPALLLLSARSPEALSELAQRYAQQLAGADRAMLDAVCWNAASRRAALAHRAAFIAEDADGMVERLRSYAAGDVPDAAGTVHATPAQAPVFVVPGQGGQWVGMARELVAREPVFRAAMESCDAAARPWLGGSLLEQLALEADAPGFRLDRIEWIQPSLLAVAIAYARWLGSLGIAPSALVGHSMGEVGAAHLAGVLELEQAMRIIVRRSALMGRTCGQGGMAMVELAMPEAEQRLAGREALLSVAVSNSPRSCVVSGDPAALQALLAELEAEGIFCRLVKVDVASHSPQMDGPAAALVAELHDLVPHAAQGPLWSTALAQRAEGEAFGAAYWGRNLRQPVRFGAVVGQLIEGGATSFVELGPHPVLTAAIVQTAQAAGREAVALACGRREEGELLTALAVVAGLWVAGHALDLTRLMPRTDPIDLPTYPWQRERHWVRQAAVPDPAQRGAPRAEPLAPERRDWLHALRWVPVEPATSGSAAGGAWLVVADDAACGAALVAALGDAGVNAAAMTPEDFETAPAQAAAARAVVRWMGDAPTTPYAPVATLQTAARATPGGRLPTLWFVTAGAQAVESPARTRVAVQAGAAWGAARVLAEEHPEAWGGLVDVDPADAAAAQAACVLRELCGPRDETQVAWRGGRRHALRLQALGDDALAPAAAPWRADASYLVTGGLGELGLHVAQAMVRGGARRLVLMGQHGLPARNAWADGTHDARTARRIAAVRALEAAGASVHVLMADTGDAAQLEAALRGFADEAWPPIRGLVHAAGLTENLLALQTDRGAFDRVAAPKLGAALHLDRLLPDLDVCVYFSSISAMLGAAGMANYAAANAGLDALAADRRARGLKALAIQWGAWEGTGLFAGAAAAQNMEQLRAQGIEGFTPADGVAIFEALLGLGAATVTVMPVDWKRLAAARRGRDLSLYGDRADLADVGGAAAGGFAARWAAAEPAERRKLMETAVREAVGQTLKLAPARIDPKQPFGTLGLSSLLAMELRNRLEATLARPLSATLAWNYPTVDALATYLCASAEGPATAAPAAAPKPAPQATPSPSLGAVAALSDDEAAQMLRRRR